MKRLPALLTLILFWCTPPSSGTTTFTGAGNWSDSDRWSGLAVPGPGEDVVIDGLVTQDVSSAMLSSYVLNANRTNVFTGTNMVLSATNLTIHGFLTHNVNTDTNGTIGVYDDWTPEHFIRIVCTSLTVSATGRIDVKGKGYAGGFMQASPTAATRGNGPGGGPHTTSSSSQGAGHGGAGGQGRDGPGGVTYGSPAAPTDPGSGGGGGYNGAGGNGGGAVFITALGPVTNHGVITADGANSASDHAGGGSGGSISLSCRTLEGTGTVSALGGSLPSGNTASGGGGGRIRIAYDTPAQGAVPRPSLIIQETGGTGSTRTPLSGAGTLHLPDSLLFPDTLTLSLRNVNVYGVTSWHPNNLTVSNAMVVFQEPDFDLSITNRLAVSGALGEFRFTATNLMFDCADLLLSGGKLGVVVKQFNYLGDTLLINSSRVDVAASLINAGTNLVLTNGASLHIYAGPTNSPVPNYSTLLQVTNNIVTSPNCWIYPHSSPTNGGSILVRARNVTGIGANSGFSAAGLGYIGGRAYGQRGQGPGGGRTSTIDNGDTGGGGGHGATGSACRSYPGVPGGGGSPYGSATSPDEPGSAGAAGHPGYVGGDGGGVIRIEAEDDVTVSGRLDASGSYSGYDHSGGGAGGSVHISCRALFGAAGASLRANGASTGINGGGGSGGRIAVVAGHIFTNAAFGLGVNPGTPGTYGSAGTGTLYLVASAPTVDNANGATNVNATFAFLNGTLSYTGLSATTVYVLWGETDEGRNLAAWANTNMFPDYPPIGPLTTNVTLLADRVYYYRFFATNAFGDGWATNAQGDGWSSKAESLITGDITILASQPSASESGDRGTVTVYRASALTNEDLVIHYETSGTATNGIDYQLSPPGSNVTILAGQTNADIVVIPLPDADPTEGDESAILSLTPGQYVIGSPSSDTVTIADYVPPPTNTWTGIGQWDESTHWSGGIVPVEGQTVIIDSGIVTQNVSSARLAAFILSAVATNVFVGTNVLLTASNVWIDGMVTHPVQSDTNAPWTPDGLVQILCTNLVISSTGRISVDAKGYRGGLAARAAGSGPGGGPTGASSSQGAGHGGAGGQGRDGAGGSTYGSLDSPVDPGSGGGTGDTGSGGNGGGAIRIVALGAVTNDGLLSANAADSTSDHSGGGAGGSIFVTCRTFEGTGVVRAAGGTLAPSANVSSSGGGGRIAIVYDSTAQGSLPQPSALFSASPGVGGNKAPYAESGSLYLSDSSMLRTTLTDTLRNVRLYGVTSWTPASIVVSNAEVTFREPSLSLTGPSQISVFGAAGRLDFVSSNFDCTCDAITVQDGILAMTLRTLTYGGANFTVSGGRLSVTADRIGFGAGDLLLTNGAQVEASATNVTVGRHLVLAAGGTTLRVYAAPTNGVNTNFTTLVTVPGDIRIGTGSWLYPHSHGTNGGNALFKANNVTMETNSGFNAVGTGYAGGRGQSDPGWYGKGPGGGKINANGAGGGGAHGGQGGTCRYGGLHNATTYGSTNAPTMPGSGGGSGYNTFVGGGGGGVIRIEAAGRIVVDGSLNARGQNDPPNMQHAGGGAGGSIFLKCNALQGAATGTILADGGNCGTSYATSQGGAGGGGRVALWYVTLSYQGTVSATNGVYGYDVAGQYALPGTIVWRQLAPPGTIFVIH